MNANPNRVISLWLFFCCAFIALVVFVGGVTRLTESGLSITEWKPVSGIIPPMSEAAWQEAFAKYQQIPEYREINFGMSLAQFKQIYWWEFFHRLLGRMIGFVFLIPFLYFAAKGYTNRALNLRLLGIFCLGGLQGVIGWYMVKSGLSIRTDVSQYRLAVHLTLAFFLFALVYWTALSVASERRTPPAARHPLIWAIIALIFLQVFLGALVAGLDAGLTYNTFPLMDGHLVPNGLMQLSPWYLNFFENITTVQFQHRWTAKLLAVLVFVFWWKTRIKASSSGLTRGSIGTLGMDPRVKPEDDGLKKAANYLLAAIVLQMILGITTLLWVVPLPLASAHQMMALVVLMCGLQGARSC